MAITPEQAAVLERQRAYFASDECLRERAAVWRDASLDERWAEVKALCAFAEKCFDQLDPAVRERALQPDPLPDDTVQLLAALQRFAR